MGYGGKMQNHEQFLATVKNKYKHMNTDFTILPEIYILFYVQKQPNAQQI